MLRKTVVARALYLAFSAAALSAVGTLPAMAQSNTVGTAYGTAPTGATSVTLRNLDTNFTRTVSVDGQGKFQATALPPGRYKATASNGASADMEILAGQGTEAVFAATGGTQTVQVTGRRSRIDVSNTNNGAVFSARELKALPIATNVDAIIQLAPSTTRADSRYAGGASFGGGGASENAYYINGFPVTNPLTQLGASELPFGAIGQAQILTGGFGAEFGRSVGGVVNITTKSGTNTWEAGARASITPNAWRSDPKDLYYPKTGAAENKATDGKLYRDRSKDTDEQRQYAVYVGGPIIKDKLFMFIAAETTQRERAFNSTSVTAQSTPATLGRVGWNDFSQHTERYMGKFDWNINDNHRLELTLIKDEPNTDLKVSGYTIDANGRIVQRNGTVVSSEHYSNVANIDGGNGADDQILKYTGNWTEDLTVQVLYGESTSRHKNTYDGYDINQKLYQISAPTAARVPGLNYTTAQVLSGQILPPGAEDKIKSSRIDLEYKLGNHTIRAGLDDNKVSSLKAGSFRAGGGLWTYGRVTTDGAGDPNKIVTLSGERVNTGKGGGLGLQGYYVQEGLRSDVTNAYSDQSAQYIEDRWQITKNFLFTAGLRNEQFTNKNGDKETFLEMKNQIAPRFSASWDVHGDASLKVFGSAGRYHVQIPTHLAVRGASRSLLTSQTFTYTGTDANGNPLGLVPITGVFSSNNEYNQPKDAKTLASLDMKPTYQDEATIGFEMAWSPDLNIGAKATYRTLKTTIDDFCDPRPIDAWAARNHVDTSNYGGFGCASFNPGLDNDFLVDFTGGQQKYTRVHLTAAELGFPEPRRTYKAVDFYAEHPLRNGWYGKVSYTWSKNQGNTEGQTLSDVAQTDVAATQTWDHPELMVDAYGLLPNHREHQLKAFGFWQFQPEWTVGGNFLAASGRPINCLGNNDNVDENISYGSSYHYCNGKPSPRGTAGTLPWDIRLDANLTYTPNWFKGLSFKADVFNLTDKQTAQTVDEVYNVGPSVSSTYGRVISYTAPRSVKLTVEYNTKF